MAEEYLVFNAVVIAGPLIAARHPATTFRGRWLPALAAVVLVAVPFVVWDVLVTGRHWSFNPAYYTFHLGGLPLGEWAFFVTVPLACLYTWEMLSGGVDPRPVRAASTGWKAALGLVLAGAAAWAFGMEYTGVACAALATACVLDLLAGGRVLRHRRFGVFALAVLACTAVFNGYLTARPLVLYDPRYQLDVRVGTIPLEDFVYGLALVVANVTLFERLRDRMGAPRNAPGDTVFRRIVRAGFGGYRRQVNVVRADAAPRLARPRRVAVVGGGLAGLRAATLLGARGFAVELFEKDGHLGGKVGAWPHRLDDGTAVEVEHGFHAFFRQYYNLRRFLDEVGASGHLRPIDDYRILARGGPGFGFRDIETAPILNILAMVGTPMLPFRELVTRPRLARLMALLTYDPARTFARYDAMSFDELANRADLPPALRVVFSSFARAFFATPDRMSAAEVIKSFHFFYLSHDHGLLYDCLDDTYGRALIDPMRARLEAVGGRVRLGSAIEAIAAVGESVHVGGDPFDYLIIATDVVGARAIADASPDLRALAPRAMANLGALTPGQPYAVLRLWLDRPARYDLPEFVIVAKDRLLDSVTFVDRVEAASTAWAAATGGAVIELHCYSVPDGFDEADVAGTLKDELWDYFPELRAGRLLGESLQIKRNFTAFHVGMRARRPAVETEHPRILLAGDWVALPGPEMLMEAAVTAGIEAANAILRREGVREEPIFSVPRRGLFAGRGRGDGRVEAAVARGTGRAS